MLTFDIFGGSDGHRIQVEHKRSCEESTRGYAENDVVVIAGT